MENNARTNNLNNLLGNSKDTKVETEQFQICGHLLRWEDVVIQISSISMVSSGKFQVQPFPLWALFFAIIGLVLFFVIWYIGLFLAALGALCIYLWYKEYQAQKDFKYLHINLASGRTFSLLFKDEQFLKKVLGVFANIFENGGKTTGENIYIDIKNCNVDHNSSIIGKVDSHGD